MIRTPWRNLSRKEKADILKPFLASCRARRIGPKTYQDCLDDNRVRNRVRRLWDANLPLDTPLTNRGIKLGTRQKTAALPREKYYWEK
jgi:hypothetical protein